MEQTIKPALDPNLSVVVEACAGSGKTWLLASRLIRLLLAGVAPSRILAITYTRKAAAEIEARLAEWLRELATAPDHEALAFLKLRGLSEPEAAAALPRARGLLEAVLLADQPPTITTFHGWFVRLVQAAPLNSGLAGLALAEAAQPLLDEAWARLARRAAREPEGALAGALLALLKDPGAHNTRTALGNFISRRAEWLAYGPDVPEALARLRDTLGVEESPCALSQFFTLPGLRSDLKEFATLLIANEGKADTARACVLIEVLDQPKADTDALYQAVREALLTQEGTPRSRSGSVAMTKRLGADRADRLISLHESLSSQARDLHDALKEEATYAFNRAALEVGQALLAELQQYKTAHRLMDFTDLETHADALLSGEDAPFLQARLDARYQHILLDEFQDTNPLQWRILRGWLDAYGPGQSAPCVFMVGDPKQSIYRFRRAEPRIFGAAAAYLTERFGAVRIEMDTTRRNAPAVVEVVNALFGAQPAFEGFRPQSAFNAELPGRVELMPLIEGQKAAPDEPAQADLRNPLALPQPIDEDTRRSREAEQIAAQINAWVGQLAIDDNGTRRPARFGDVMLLCRSRTHLAHYERALRRFNIPYFSGSRAGLLHTLEAQDLSALLGFFTAPADDLKLAHVLRSPIFAVSDADLISVFAGRPHHGWQQLESLVAGQQASAELVRAHQLLARWLEASAHLPVHDVLAAVYFEGDVMARYRAAVPPLMWPGVRANLEAYIRLSLEQGGGRYPSLTRFNDELKRLQSAADEAPDEGVISSSEGGSRVRILTIHAAKGLEAPLVWLIDADAAQAAAEGFDVLLDWPPGEAAPTHFSLFGNQDSRGRRRAHLFDQEARAALREELNLLYVAITRARQYFVASGVAPARKASRVSFYAYLREAIERLGGEGASAHGAPWEPLPPAPRSDQVELPTQPYLPRLGIGKPRDEMSEAQRYGTALHHALEALSAGAAPPQDCEPGVIEHAKSILAAPHLKRFFDPAQYRWARNEIEFALADGSSGRVDRLVDTGEALWILDYKSSRDPVAAKDAHRRQLDRYRDVVGQLHPGKLLRAALVLGDGGLVEL